MPTKLPVTDFYISDSFITFAQQRLDNNRNRPAPVIIHRARFRALFDKDMSINLGGLSPAVQAELIEKSEIVAAQRYTSGINSLFWKCSKEAAQRLSRHQIDSLPEDEKLVVNTAASFSREGILSSI